MKSHNIRSTKTRIETVEIGKKNGKALAVTI